MITVLDRYLFRQLFWSILFAIVLFSIIWLAPETLFKLTQYVFSNEITLGKAFGMLLLHIPGVIQQSIPVAALLGCLFVFQRLSSQYEVVALFAAGVSPKRLMQSVLCAGAVFAAVLIAFNELVIPVTGPMLEDAYMGSNLKDTPDRNFVFVEKNDQNRLQTMFLIGQAQKEKLSDFIVLDYQPDVMNQGTEIRRIVRANTGYWMSVDKKWKLQGGISYELNSEGVYQNIESFKERLIPMSAYSAKLLQYSVANPKYLNIVRLNRYIQLLGEGGQMQEVPYFEVRLYQKLVAPLAALFFAVVGALLGIERVRAHKNYGLLFGAVLVFVYSVLMPFSGNIAAATFLPVWLVAWFPLMVSALVAWLLLTVKKQLP